MLLLLFIHLILTSFIYTKKKMIFLLSVFPSTQWTRLDAIINFLLNRMYLFITILIFYWYPCDHRVHSALRWENRNEIPIRHGEKYHAVFMNKNAIMMMPFWLSICWLSYMRSLTWKFLSSVREFHSPIFFCFECTHRLILL